MSPGHPQPYPGDMATSSMESLSFFAPLRSFTSPRENSVDEVTRRREGAKEENEGRFQLSLE